MIRICSLILVMISLSLISCHNNNGSFALIKKQLSTPIQNIDINYKKIPTKIKNLQKNVKNKTNKVYSNLLAYIPGTNTYDTILSKDIYSLIEIYDNNIVKFSNYSPMKKLKKQYENIGKINFNKDSTIGLNIERSAIALKVVAFI